MRKRVMPKRVSPKNKFREARDVLMINNPVPVYRPGNGPG